MSELTPSVRLRQRMLEDMAACKLNPDTQRDHIYNGERFAPVLRRSPDAATANEVRHFPTLPHRERCELRPLCGLAAPAWRARRRHAESLPSPPPCSSGGPRCFDEPTLIMGHEGHRI
jgi:hypothetical protein